MANLAERTVLIFGAAAIAGVVGVASAQAQSAPAAPAPAAPVTPRTADGHPDLSGVWVAGGVGALASGAEAITFAGRGNSFVGFEADGGLFREFDRQRSPIQARVLEPDHRQRVQRQLRRSGELLLPLGVPRMGAPHEILNVAGQPEIILLYMAGFNGYGGSYESWDQHRMIPTDGRAHNPQYVAYEIPDRRSGRSLGRRHAGHRVGRVHRRELAAQERFIHGFNMKVTERLTRAATTLTWQATVDDPDYLRQAVGDDPVMRAASEHRPERPSCRKRYPCRYIEPSRTRTCAAASGQLGLGVACRVRRCRRQA